MAAIGGGIRILAIGRKSAASAAASRRLSGRGFEIEAVRAGPTAIRRAAGEAYDAILFDVRIRDEDSLGLVRALRSKAVDVPVILVLNEWSNRTALAAAELGAVQPLVRPVAPEALERALRIGAGVGSRARPSDGEVVSVSATRAKNEFGRYLEKAVQGGRVVIEKHDSPRAVMVSIGEFESLSRWRNARLGALTQKFDALVDRMQGSKARRAAQTAFEASPEELAKAAVAAARNGG